jgi:hypothetical protein
MRDELRDVGPPPRRSWIPEDLKQVINWHKIDVFSSGSRKSFALPRLPSDSRAVSRAFWATSAFPKTPMFSSHLDNLIFFELFSSSWT